MPENFLDFIPGGVSGDPAPTDTGASGLGYEPSMGTYDGSLDSDDAGWGTLSVQNNAQQVDGAGPGSIPTGVPVVDCMAAPTFRPPFVRTVTDGPAEVDVGPAANPSGYDHTTWAGQTEWVDRRANKTNSGGT